jgi:enediyne biosynthesis protein E4
VHAGASYLSSEDSRAHFGLGGANQIREVVVRWPDGETTRLTDVAANDLIEVSAS